MKLSARLAFRPNHTPGPSSVVAGTGFTHQCVRFRVGEALGTSAANDTPRGFELLRLPTARELESGLGELELAALGERDACCPVMAIDIETTGLDGLTAIPYMICAAWHEGDEVVVEQWTLRRPAAERSLLSAAFTRLSAVASPRTRLVSFNGASFDLPRLRTRAARLQLPTELLGRPHVDLVVAARRLWKGVHPDCRLGTLEQEVLGVRRRGDISGAEVAGLWDQLQRYPKDDWTLHELARAEQHNRADVIALLALLARMAIAVAKPVDLQGAIRAARHRVLIDQVEGARAVLMPLLAPLLRDATASPLAVEAAMLLAELERRLDAHQRAAQLWNWVCKRQPGHALAHEALAKFLEHRAHAPKRALEVAAASAEPCPRRLARLRRKLSA